MDSSPNFFESELRKRTDELLRAIFARDWEAAYTANLRIGHRLRQLSDMEATNNMLKGGRPENCRKFSNCEKVAVIFDKDFPDPQLYRELVTKMCEKCGDYEK